MTAIAPNGYFLITGASQGIGACFAEALAKKGSNLILVARGQKKLNTLAALLRNTYHVRVQVLVKDLSAASAVAEVAHYCTDFSIDGLINNAGMGRGARFNDEPLDRVMVMLNLNIVSLTELTHRLVPKLRQCGGVVINVASTAAFLPVPYMAVYAATKSYVLHCGRDRPSTSEISGSVPRSGRAHRDARVGLAQVARHIRVEEPILGARSSRPTLAARSNVRGHDGALVAERLRRVRNAH